MIHPRLGFEVTEGMCRGLATSGQPSGLSRNQPSKWLTLDSCSETKLSDPIPLRTRSQKNKTDKGPASSPGSLPVSSLTSSTTTPITRHRYLNPEYPLTQGEIVEIVTAKLKDSLPVNTLHWIYHPEIARNMRRFLTESSPGQGAEGETEEEAESNQVVTAAHEDEVVTITPVVKEDRYCMTKISGNCKKQYDIIQSASRLRIEQQSTILSTQKVVKAPPEKSHFRSPALASKARLALLAVKQREGFRLCAPS